MLPVIFTTVVVETAGIADAGDSGMVTSFVVEVCHPVSGEVEADCDVIEGVAR